MTISKIGLASTAAAALLVLAACGTSGSSDEESASAPSTATSAQPSSSAAASEGPASSTTAEAVSITIKDFEFQTPETVAPGAKVTVTNKDSATHTVTADRGDAFDVTVPGNDSATFTAPSKPGTSEFHCTFHANMQGTLVVKK